MKILQGQLIAQQILEEIRPQLSRFVKKPQLHIIVCQNGPLADLTDLYLREKKRLAKLVNISVKVHKLSQHSQREILSLIESLNRDEEATGILVQLPLPDEIEINKVIWAIRPEKDVDGFQMRKFMPPAPQAVIRILQYRGERFLGLRVHIVGQGILVGRPLGIMLRRLGAEVTVSDSQTPRSELARLVARARVVVSACGKPGVILPEWVSQDQILIDAGCMVVKGVQQGDIDFDKFKQRVGAITPARAGVGPVTVAILMENMLKAAAEQMKIDR